MSRLAKYTRLAEMGLTIPEAARILGIRPSSAWEYAKRHGIIFRPARGPKKEITLVLESVEAGAETSAEVAADTGLSLKVASAYLSQLATADAIIRAGTFYDFALKRKYNRYALKEPSA